MRDEEVVRRFDLLELSPGDYWIVAKCGLLIMTFAYIMAGVIAANTGVESWLFVFTPPAVGVLYSAGMIWAANRRLSPAQRTRLAQQRALTVRLEDFRAASAVAATDSATTGARLNQLRDLAVRMKRLDAKYLTDRVGEIEGLITSLEEQVQLDAWLSAAYDHECQLLSIQVDTLDTAPPENTSVLEAKLAELAVLKEVTQARRIWREVDEAVSELVVPSWKGLTGSTRGAERG